MIFVEQTIMEPPTGNCFAACLASILELGIDEVPNFILSGTWKEDLSDWLGPMNLGLVYVGVDIVPNYYGLLILTVLLEGGRLHSLVVREGQVVWDPSPHRAANQIYRPLSCSFITILDPSLPTWIPRQSTEKICP